MELNKTPQEPTSAPTGSPLTPDNAPASSPKNKSGIHPSNQPPNSSAVHRKPPDECMSRPSATTHEICSNGACNPSEQLSDSEQSDTTIRSSGSSNPSKQLPNSEQSDTHYPYGSGRDHAGEAIIKDDAHLLANGISQRAETQITVQVQAGNKQSENLPVEETDDTGVGATESHDEIMEIPPQGDPDTYCGLFHDMKNKVSEYLSGKLDNPEDKDKIFNNCHKIDMAVVTIISSYFASVMMHESWDDPVPDSLQEASGYLTRVIANVVVYLMKYGGGSTFEDTVFGNINKCWSFLGGSLIEESANVGSKRLGLGKDRAVTVFFKNNRNFPWATFQDANLFAVQVGLTTMADLLIIAIKRKTLEVKSDEGVRSPKYFGSFTKGAKLISLAFNIGMGMTLKPTIQGWAPSAFNIQFNMKNLGGILSLAMPFLQNTPTWPKEASNQASLDEFFSDNITTAIDRLQYCAQNETCKETKGFVEALVNNITASQPELVSNVTSLIEDNFEEFAQWPMMTIIPSIALLAGAALATYGIWAAKQDEVVFPLPGLYQNLHQMAADIPNPDSEVDRTAVRDAVNSSKNRYYVGLVLMASVALAMRVATSFYSDEIV